MAPKKITVEGVGVKLGSHNGYKDWLKTKGIQRLIDSDGDEIADFESLLDGGTYTRGPPQQQQPPLAKRQRELQTWGELQNSVKSPTEVPLPELIEELPPPAFVAPKGWLDGLCEEVRVQFNRQDSENPRVSPVAVVRCSRGGKTRALHELAWSLPLTLRNDNETGAAIIYVSFNGQTPLSPWEKNRPLEALCRRILYTALGGKPNPNAFNSFATSTVFEKEDVTDWLGDAQCILLIDELNLLEATMNEDFATFLKDTFLLDTGRALVFSSHVVSVNNTLTSYMHSQSEREVKMQQLPLARNLFQAKDLLGYAVLSPYSALYLGLIPALYYGAMQSSLPHQRREDAIQKYVDTGVSREKVETLLMTMLTGEYALVPEMFRELMDIDVIEKKPIALWIPYHMTQVLLTLSRLPALPIAVRRCLGAIYEQFESFRTQKIQSGDGWEALFIVTLLTRCLTKSFCELVPLYGFDCEVSRNDPFDTQVDFGCESVEEFVSGIPFRHSTKSISIYFPTHAKFQAYDVILACWGDNLQRELFDIGHGTCRFQSCRDMDSHFFSSFVDDQEMFESFLNYPDVAEMQNPMELDRIQQHQFADQELNQMRQRHPDRFPVKHITGRPLICHRTDANVPEGDWRICSPTALLDDVVAWRRSVLGHCGIARLCDTIRTHCCHPELKRKCEVFTCAHCQRNEALGAGHGELPSREAPLAPWDEVAVDLVGPWTITVQNADVKFFFFL